MRKLLAQASLLLALAAPAPLLPTPAAAAPLPARSEALARVAPLPVIPPPPADLPQRVKDAYYYLVGIVGIEPCDALKVVLGSETSTNAQRYAHARLQEIGYDFPTPDPEEAFDCPL